MQSRLLSMIWRSLSWIKFRKYQRIVIVKNWVKYEIKYL